MSKLPHCTALTSSLLLLILTCSLSACKGGQQGKDPVVPPKPAPDKTELIKLRITPEVWPLRATDTFFEEGDQVGVFMVNYKDNTPGALASKGNHLDNARHQLVGSVWQGDKKYYYKDKTTKVDLYCYYPYSSRVTDGDIHSYRHKVATDQSTHKDYTRSDLMWGVLQAVTPTKDPVPITVNHSLSSIVISIKCEGGYSDEELAEAKVRITEVMPEAVIDLATGKTRAEGDRATITPLHKDSKYYALLPPQEVSNDHFVTVEIKGTTYRFPMTRTFESNKRYTTTLTVKRITGGIDIGIGGWEVEDIDNGGVAE